MGSTSLSVDLVLGDLNLSASDFLPEELFEVAETKDDGNHPVYTEIILIRNYNNSY